MRTPGVARVVDRDHDGAVVGSPVGGALSDRRSPAKLLATLSLLSAIPPILVAVLAFESELTVPLLYLLVFLARFQREWPTHS